MTKIFISYRRDDSQYVTDTIYEHMTRHFGKENVFLDVGSIPFGVDFRQHLNDQVTAHDVVLVIIGPDWTRIMQERADQANDFVRIEIESALKHEKLVIPVLVKNATMPDFSQLPESIQDLQWRNSALVRRQPDLENDCNRLVEGIRQYMGTLSPVATTSQSSPTDDVQAAIERAWNFKGKRNSDWKPFVTTFPDIDEKIPGITFCLVPIGSFMMGSNDGKDNEKPAHIQTIKRPYWIAQYPVINMQWQPAVKAGIAKSPHSLEFAIKWYKDPAFADLPVVGVDWFMVRDFATWLECRLPTECEWEYAACGVESLVYPWGDDWNLDNVVWDKNKKNHPSPVTLKPEGKSWIAAWHMSGNVAEWTNSLYEPYPYYDSDGRERDTGDSINVERVLRGDAYNGNPDQLRCSHRGHFQPDTAWWTYWSFRLARSID